MIIIYPYITTDNFEYPQKYQYTTYEGMAFIRSYLASRDPYLRPDAPLVQDSSHMDSFWSQLEYEAMDQERAQDVNLLHLLPIILTLRKRLSIGTDLSATLENLDAIVKTFEIHKRLYTHYTAEFKLTKEQNYRDIRLYLIFADSLTMAYQRTQKLKYLNALLKVNDALLSQHSLVQRQSAEPLYQILEQVITFEVQEVKKMLGLYDVRLS